jgi:glutathione S-transferase
VNEIILHHYDASPFSEKVRVVLGIKGLAWRSVQIPAMLPKPLYTPLTGGYRRTPSMQVGADVYCDSQCIIRELERRFPSPTLFPDGGEGMHHALAAWTDKVFFQAAVGVIFGRIGDRVPQAFIDDRTQMSGTPFDLARMKAAVPVMHEQLRAHARLIETQLRDGRAFLFGDAPGLADAQVYHVTWWLRTVLPEAAERLDRLPRYRAWNERMRAIGHGRRTEMSAEEALAIARDATPETLPQGDANEPNGLQPGDRIEVAPDDYGRDAVRGELVRSSALDVALLRQDPDLGEIVQHFPRIGFVVVKLPSPPAGKAPARKEGHR